MTFAMLLLLGFITQGGTQGLPMDKPSVFDSLNQKAAQAHDESSTRALFEEIQGRTLGGPIPKSMLKRLVRAQRDFQAGIRAPVTEEALAAAINELGRKLNPEIYSGTNALQLHLLRAHYMRELNALLASPDRAQPGSGDNLLTPAGAVYIGLLLLRQKLANPAWFGDPDAQNKIWMDYQASHSSPAQTKYQYRVTVQAEPPEETKLRLMLMELAHKDSATTKAFRQFLDTLAF